MVLSGTAFYFSDTRGVTGVWPQPRCARTLVRWLLPSLLLQPIWSAHIWIQVLVDSCPFCSVVRSASSSSWSAHSAHASSSPFLCSIAYAWLAWTYSACSALFCCASYVRRQTILAAHVLYKKVPLYECVPDD